jgi:hypothetical protein
MIHRYILLQMPDEFSQPQSLFEPRRCPESAIRLLKDMAPRPMGNWYTANIGRQVLYGERPVRRAYGNNLLNLSVVIR